MRSREEIVNDTGGDVLKILEVLLDIREQNEKLLTKNVLGKMNDDERKKIAEEMMIERIEAPIRKNIEIYANMIPSEKIQFVVDHCDIVREMLDYLVNRTKDK